MTPSPLPSRKNIVRVLERTADLLDVLAADEFKAKAYRSAARSLETLPSETPELLERGFAGIPKVGKATALELVAWAETGRFAPLDEAAAQLPAGLLDLLDVRGLGPKKIRALWQAGIESLERLREACESGEVAALKGFGAKSAASILESVEFLFEARTRQHLSTGLDIVERLVSQLGDLEARAAGDVRRGLDTVRVARVTVTGRAEEVAAKLAGQVEDLAPVEKKPLFAGQMDGAAVEIAYTPAEARGALDLMMGGSTHYREGLRAEAAAGGYDLSGRGLKKDGVLIPTPSEQEVLRELGLPYRPAEYREAEHDEVWQTLPAPEQLIQVSDLRGMLHTHSLWSDGAASIRDMAAEAVRLGHEFLGTGDHSRAAHYANGLSVERLREQLKEVRELQAAGVPLVAGAEVDILEDGSLDYPDDVLSELDYVVASVHSHFTLDSAGQTERLIRAVQHPLVTILGHATGRLLLRRGPYALDLDAVLGACEAAGTVVEINANAYRLDVDWRFALRWRERLQWAINTDAHVPEGLRDARYGVLVARKAGLTPEMVVNTLGRADFLKFVQEQRAKRSS